MKNLKSIFGGAVAASSSIAVTVGVTLWAELSAPFKAWLAGFTGHHWVSKSWLSLIVFFGVFAVLMIFVKNVSFSGTRAVLRVLFGSLLVGTLILLGFFMFEFFKH